MSKTLTLAEVAAHDREEDCYLIIGNERTGGAKVYDVTKYLDEHPGGDAVLLELAGKYADDMFEDIGHSMNARQQLKEFLVGTLDATEEELQALRAPATATSKKESPLPVCAGARSAWSSSSVASKVPTRNSFSCCRAFIEWPMSSNISSAYLPASSSRTASPPGCSSRYFVTS